MDLKQISVGSDVVRKALADKNPYETGGVPELVERFPELTKKYGRS